MKKKVLIVDDDNDIREPFARVIESWGFHAYTAKNGKEAIAIAGKKKVDLIVLDIDLPDISGMEVCKILKGNPATQKIPILMLSAMGKGSVVDEGFSCGADDYIIKDVDFDLLKSKVFRLLKIENQ
jgi:DNA-binding response OmpR family regulator